MDRSPANLGDIINNIQRDLDELKMAQAKGIEDGSITNDKIDWSAFTANGSSAVIVCPNSSEVAGWRVHFSGYISSAASAGSLSASNAEEDGTFTVRNCGSNGTVGTTYELLSGTDSIPLYRGANTSFAGWSNIELTIMKSEMDAGARFMYNCDTSLVSSDNSYQSHCQGSYLVSDTDSQFSLTVSKGTASFSNTSWHVEMLYKPGVVDGQ